MESKSAVRMEITDKTKSLYSADYDNDNNNTISNNNKNPLALGHMAIYVRILFIMYAIYSQPQSLGFDVITILKIIKTVLPSLCV